MSSFCIWCKIRGTSLVAQLVKNLPAMQETPIWVLGQEDLLEKGRATHSSSLAWIMWWTVYPWDHIESDMTKWLLLTHERLPHSIASAYCFPNTTVWKHYHFIITFNDLAHLVEKFEYISVYYWALILTYWYKCLSLCDFYTVFNTIYIVNFTIWICEKFNFVIFWDCFGHLWSLEILFEI